MSPRSARHPRRAWALLSVLVVGGAVLATSSAAQARPTTAGRAGLPIAMKLSAAAPSPFNTASPMPSVGQAPAPEEWPDAPVTLNSLHRDSSGFVSLTWSVRNNGDSQFTLPAQWISTVYRYAPGPSSAITLTDESGKVRYSPLRMDPSGVCVCSDTTKLAASLDHGASAILTETYKLPAQVKSVTVSIPGYSAAKNVPIS